VTLTYTDELTGKADQESLYREDEARLGAEKAGRAWSMDADGNLFRFVSEAKRISLAHLFDPLSAMTHAAGSAAAAFCARRATADEAVPSCGALSTTRAPSATSACAAANPRPRLPPVTR
jgi:hypothetical protein